MHLERSLQIFLSLLIILVHQAACADDETKPRKTVCLNMIVKNEADVIRRGLASSKPLIDYWVIVDTGSTDGTQDIIREFMKDMPGELHERPWKNFAHNRNEALKLARGKSDYILIIDADETFEYEPGFKLPELDKQLYHITTKHGGMRYERVQLIDSKIDFEWRGVLHEALYNPEPITRGSLVGIYDIYGLDGARSKDPKKFEKDVAVLEVAVAENPNHHRYVFYLAQSYRDAKNHLKSIEYYQRRVDLGGWDQEVFWSLLQIARLQGIIKEASEKIQRSYYRAFQYRPSRVEPLYYLALLYRNENNFDACYSISKLAKTIPLSNDGLFVERWIYDWGLLMENSVSAYYLGKYQEAIDLSTQILNQPDLPQNIRETVERNLKLGIDKVSEASRCINNNGLGDCKLNF